MRTASHTLSREPTMYRRVAEIKLKPNQSCPEDRALKKSALDNNRETKQSGTSHVHHYAVSVTRVHYFTKAWITTHRPAWTRQSVVTAGLDKRLYRRYRR